MIPIEKILEAKEKMGERATKIIAEDLGLNDPLDSHCPFHDEDTASFKWNYKDNAYKCFGCGIVYGIIDHYKEYYKLTFLKSIKRLFNETNIEHRFYDNQNIQREYIYPHEEKGHDRISVENYWKTRGISKKTLDYANVQSDSNGNTAFHFYNLDDVLCMVKYRPSRKIKKDEKTPKFWWQAASDKMPLLYGINQVDPSQPLLICEGPPDRLAAIEAGFKNVVSVPHGANSYDWIEECWGFLKQFNKNNKIIVWADNDKSGIKMRKEVCPRLEALSVEIPENLEKEIDGKIIKPNDINEVLHLFGKLEVIKCIENAQEVPIQNIVDLADVDDFDIESAPGLYSGIKGLDNIIYKFLFGSVILFTGLKSSGKSTILNQIFICEALEQGYDVFFFSGEMSNPVIRNWIETTMSGRENIKMKNKFVRVINPEARKSMRDWYQGRIWNFDGMENDIDIILNRAIAVTKRFGVKVWVIDNLMALHLGQEGNISKWDLQKEFIVKLANLAELYGVLIILVTHPKKIAEFGRRIVSDDIAGSSDLGNRAHYILAAHRYTKKEKEGELKYNSNDYKPGKEPIEYDMALEVLKNRYTGYNDEVQLYFCPQTYRFFHTAEELWKRYKWNKDSSPLPTHNPRLTEELPDFMN